MTNHSFMECMFSPHDLITGAVCFIHLLVIAQQYLASIQYFERIVLLYQFKTYMWTMLNICRQIQK